jgi:hypothetical protein
MMLNRNVKLLLGFGNLTNDSAELEIFGENYGSFKI